jgi:DNA polymerase-3 subunit epsilon
MDLHLPQIGIGAFVDVETTGLDDARDEIVELSIALFAFERSTGKIVGVIEQYAGQRDPGIPIPVAALRVHRISNEDVKGKELDRRKIESIMERAEFIAAHNAGFDRRFVEKMFPPAESKPWYCSMNGINWQKKGFESKGLQNLVKRHNIPIEQTHRAAGDFQLALLLLSQPSDKNDGAYHLLELISEKPLR